MQISIQGKGLDIGDSLRTRAEQGLQGTTGKYFGDAVEGRARFSRRKNAFRADLSVHIGHDILVQSHGEVDDPYAAFETALERMDKRLRRYHRRLRSHRRRAVVKSGLAAQQYVLAPLQEETESQDMDHDDATDNAPVIVAEMSTEVTDLSVSEAVMRMDLSDQPALLFRNSANGRINMVYQRSDGHIGWIDPDMIKPSST